MPVKLSLNAKAALLTSAVLVVLLAAAGYLQLRQLERDFSAVVRAQLDTLGESIVEDLAGRLEAYRSVVEHSASLVDETMLADPERAQDFVSRIAATRVLFDGTAIVAPDGRVLVNDPPLPPGRVVSIADRPYFQRIVQSGQTEISPPVQTRTGRGPGILIVTPIRSEAGQVLGYFSAGLQLQRANVLGSLAMSSIGRTGHVEVVTRGAAPIFVVHPDVALLLQPAPVPARGPLEIDYIVGTKQLRGIDWELRLVLPEWEANAPLLQARRELLRNLALLGLGSAVVTWLAIRQLLRPLATLSRTMRRLRRHPQSRIELDLRGDDERGELARAFADLMQESRARQAEMQAITERSPLGMFRAGPDGRLSYVNEAYLKIHGLAPEQAAQGWLQLIDPELREQAWADWLQAVNQAQPLLAHREIVRPDGQRRELVVRSSPVTVGEQVLGHVGTVFDATERMAQEKAQRVLSTIFETSPDYVVQTDREGYLTYANPAVRQLEGLAPDAPIGNLNFASFNPPETNARFASEVLPAVRARGVWIGETEILDGHGRRVPVSHMVIAHRGASGRVDHFSAVMRDLSATARARLAAEQAAATLRLVADQTLMLLCVVDNDLRYRFVNKGFEDWIGLPQERILGREVTQVLGTQELAASLPYAQRALAGETVAFERVDERGPSLRYLSVSYVPVRLPGGATDGFVGVLLDVTQHRQEALRLRLASERDPLTGVLNRAGFDSHMQAVMAAGAGPRLALLYLDLDHFKPVNDTLGHAAGDTVLQAFAQRLQRLVRPSDAVARLGGDEFALALADVPDLATAERIAEKVVAAAGEPFPVGGTLARIGASVGVSFGLRPGEDWQAMLQRADGAVYASKRAGRGRHMPAADADAPQR